MGARGEDPLGDQTQDLYRQDTYIKYNHQESMRGSIARTAGSDYFRSLPHSPAKG